MSAVTRARGWLFDLFVHHHAENLRTQRAVVRKMQGVPMEDLPYPGSSVVVNTNTPAPDRPAPPVAAKAAWLPAIVAMAGLLLGGGGLAGFATGILPLKTPMVQPMVQPIVQPADSKETVTWISEDGGKTWKQVPISQP